MATTDTEDTAEEVAAAAAVMIPVAAGIITIGTMVMTAGPTDTCDTNIKFKEAQL